MKRVFYRQTFEKPPNAKFHENSSSGSQVVPCGQRDRGAEVTTLTFAYRNTAKLRKRKRRNRDGDGESERARKFLWEEQHSSKCDLQRGCTQTTTVDNVQIFLPLNL
jgi:hypothetical protein